ncbi:DUF4293 domain-containing protein [Pedobacter sp. GR22-6]|uniref:DUF4293 domain-containing protein n=1 Tax=Pedobacter sp. GR22-6 TaxID=3127957 RepID=UPI00307F7C8F
MIQRIQSIWLLLAGLTILLLLVLPPVTLPADAPEVPRPSTLLLIANLFIALLSLLNIFNFKNRSLQKNLILLNIVLTLALCAWIFVTFRDFPGGLEDVKPSIGAFMPLLSIIFSALAYRGIRRDEQLLRSADRLR